MKPISVVVSTKKIDDDYVKHIRKMFSHPKTEIKIYENNGEFSLSQIYNRGLSESTNNIVVFIHDDLILETQNITPKLNKLFENNIDYGIIGIAGTTCLDNGKWWHNGNAMQGQIKHQNNGKTWRSDYSGTFGDTLKEVVIVDGVFFAVSKDRLKKQFDEEFKGFHHYDLAFCFANFIEGVKIGVTTKIEIIHKSLGEVNKEWEKNKLFFEAKYDKQLPQIIDENCDITTYIICHDANIIEKNIESEKYNSLGKVIFMYVGNGNHEKLDKFNDNVIIVKNLKYNIEEYPKFTAFTAWYALWKNKLITSKYINLLEYDTNIKNDFSFNLKNVLIKKKPNVLSFFPFDMNNYHYINNSDWVSSISEGIEKVYKISVPLLVENVMKHFKKNNINPSWPSTNNVCFETNTFEKYMLWIEPLIDYMKNDPNAGHNQERALSFFIFLTNTPIYFFQGFIDHIQADSHKTQGHIVTKNIDL